MVKTDKIIFYASLAALVFFVAPIFVWSQDSYQTLLALKVHLENTFGSTYQILTFSVLLFVLWLAFSKHGKNDLGAGVATGVYIYSIEAGKHRNNKKTVFLK